MNAKNIGRVAVVAAGLTLAASSGALAQATDIKSMTSQLNTQMNSLGNLAGMIAFLAGFVFGIMGFMKLRANAQNPQDPSNKVSTAFMLIFIGAGLIAVPTVMGIGVNSLFGDSSNTTNLSGDGGAFTAIK
jgi:hypothetical protein